MNKRGQMIPSQEGSGFGNAHPILLLGIFIFIVPFLGMAVNWKIPGWISGIGVVLIIAGALLSALTSP